MKAFITLALILNLTSCSGDKGEITDQVWLKARVVETSEYGCYGPRLYFKEDSEWITKITGLAAQVYISNGLPAELKILDKKVWVRVRTLKGEEGVVCPANIPNFAGIKILEAKPRE